MNNLMSIIIPCYNYGKYLEECVKSVINNVTDLDIEIIIVDDASTDNSFEIAKKLEQTFNFCKVIKNDINKKLPYTRNKGIKNSNGNYIICLDADDLIPDNYIQENIKIIDNGVDISYSDSQCFGTINKRFNWPNFNIEILRQNNFIHCAAMYRREVWEKVGGYDESFIYGSEDYDFWLRAAKLGFNFKKCEKTHLLYRRTNETMIDSVSHLHVNEIKEQLKIKHKEFYKGG